MDIALCTRAQSRCNSKGHSPNYSQKVRSIAFSKMSWYAEALRFRQYCPVVASFTPLHLMFGIVLGDVRLASSCSAMETHSMKLPLHSFCADINVSWSLELYGISRALATFAHHASQDPALWLYVVFHFMARLLPLSNNTTYSSMWNQSYHSTMLEFTELFRMTLFFPSKNVCNCRLHG